MANTNPIGFMDNKLVNGSSTIPATGSGTVDETGLWDGDSTINEPPVLPDVNLEKTRLESEIARLEAEIAELKADKSVLEAQKRELENMKKSLESRKAILEAEINANDEKIQEWQEKIAELEAEKAQEQAMLEELKEKYDEENKKCLELNKQLNEKIAELLEESGLSVKNQKETFDAAKKEADEKLEAGEITEDEYAQYLAQKLGVESNAKTSALFSEINSINSQIKQSTSVSAQYLAEMGQRETNINKLDAEITSGYQAIEEVKAVNLEKNTELSQINSSLDTINAEIASVDSEIAAIDSQIADKEAQIDVLNQELDALENPEGETPDEPDVPDVPPSDEQTPGEENPDNQPSGEETTPPTVNSSWENPFVGVSFEKVEYASVVDALNVMCMNNDNAIAQARQQVEANEEEKRNFFQQQMQNYSIV